MWRRPAPAGATFSFPARGRLTQIRTFLGCLTLTQFTIAEELSFTTPAYQSPNDARRGRRLFLCATHVGSPPAKRRQLRQQPPWRTLHLGRPRSLPSERSRRQVSQD